MDELGKLDMAGDVRDAGRAPVPDAGRRRGWLARLFGGRRIDQGGVGNLPYSDPPNALADPVFTGIVRSLVLEARDVRAEASDALTLSRKERDAWALIAGDAMALAEMNRDRLQGVEAVLVDLRAVVDGIHSEMQIANMTHLTIQAPEGEGEWEGARDAMVKQFGDLVQPGNTVTVVKGLSPEWLRQDTLRSALGGMTAEVLAKPIPAEVREVLARVLALAELPAGGVPGDA